MKQFYFDKKVLIGRFFYGIIYLLLNIKVWFYSTRGFNTKTDHIIGLIAILILIDYLIKTIWIAIITFRKIPGLTISEESIYDYQYGITFFGKDVKTCTLWNNTVVLRLNNPIDYINLIRNPIWRVISKMWYAIFKKKKFRIGLRILDTDGGLIFNQFEKYDLLSKQYLTDL